jgi:putative Mn2+ efflux pump MntP
MGREYFGMKHSLSKRFPKLRLDANMRFRKKVMFGVGLSVVAALAGGVNAIYNVRKVEEAVNFSAVSASPLLIGLAAADRRHIAVGKLSEAAKRLRSRHAQLRRP